MTDTVADATAGATEDTGAWRTQATTSLPRPVAMYIDFGKHHIQPSSYLTSLLSPGETKVYHQHLTTLSKRAPVVWNQFTADHVSRLIRLLPILAKTRERTATFTQLADELDWGERTANTYWGTLLSAMKLLEIEQTVEDHALTSMVERRAAAAPIWDLDDDSQVVSDQQIQLLQQLAKTASPNSPWRAAWIALTWGQRLGDTLKMSARNVYNIEDRVTVSITEGKTVATTGPYSLSAPNASIVAKYVWEAATFAGNQAEDDGGETRMFTDPTHARERWIPVMEAEITRTLGIDARALRRTGLIRLAMTNVPLETLLTFSRHSSTRMLELYLQRGMFHASAAKRQCDAVRAAEESVMPKVTSAWPW